VAPELFDIDSKYDPWFVFESKLSGAVCVSFTNSIFASEAVLAGGVGGGDTAFVTDVLSISFASIAMVTEVVTTCLGSTTEMGGTGGGVGGTAATAGGGGGTTVLIGTCRRISGCASSS